jgi:hypothetical protein
MSAIPPGIEPLVLSFSVAFTQPSFQRFTLVLVGAILTRGDRTLTRILQTMHGHLHGHASSYHRLFSRRVWSLWPLARVLAAAVLECVPADRPVCLAVDDTAEMHRGSHVWGKGRHHDAKRSSHTHIVWLYGHRWVVLSVLVRFPFASRPWALPVLVALYRTKEHNRAEGHRHKTPPELARQLLAVMMHWFPQRKFILLGDGGYASHGLARFCSRHRDRATLISRFRPDAALYQPPPPPRKGRSGRPRVKGRKLPTPQQTVARRRRTRAVVDWYGGQSRRVSLLSAVGCWYRAGEGLVPLRWVHVRDRDGTHRDDWIFSTDPDLSPDRIVSLFTGRWSIEVTFQEARAHLGLESTRVWTKASVLRAAPCLLGLFSVVSLIFAEYARTHRVVPQQTLWYAKPHVTFSDALATVRRLLWPQMFLHAPSAAAAWKNLPPPFRQAILGELCRAA